MDELQQNFAELIRLLEEAGQQDLATLVRVEITTESAAGKFACSLEMWGGSGSIADQAGIDGNTGKPVGNPRALREALIAIAEAQTRLDLNYPRANSWADTFRAWRALPEN